MPAVTSPFPSTASAAMPIDEILALLREWATLQKELSAPLDTLSSLTGAMPDCPLLDPIYRVWSAYTEMVSQKVGDKSEWLSYYESECEMGAKPHEVSWTNPDGSKEAVKMSSLEQLAYVLTH